MMILKALKSITFDQIAKKYLHVQQIPKPDAHEPSLVPPFEVHSAAIKD